MVVAYFNQTAFLLASLMISVATLAYTLVLKRTERVRNKIFVMLLVLNSLCTLCEMNKALVRILSGKATTATIVLLDGLEYIHSVSHILIPLFFCVYIIQANGSYRQMRRIRVILFAMPAVIVEFLILTNPIHRQVYYHDSRLQFHGGWGMALSYALAGIYILFGTVNLIIHRKAISRNRLYGMLFFFPVVIAGIFTQLFFNGVKSELFAVSLILLGIMLTMENEDDRKDTVTGVYNRGELRRTLANLFRLETPFHAIAIRLSNYDILMRLSGQSGVDPVMQRVSEYLKEEYYWYRIYRASPTTFLILNDLSKEENIRLSERIYVRFEEGLFVKGVDTPIEAQFIRADIPEELFSVEDVMLMADSPLDQARGVGILHGEELSWLTRSTDLEEALRRGIENESFSLRYLPVHALRGLRPFALKALVRLHDPQLGDLMPGEFIPQAERTGHIHQMGDMVLKDVCRFLRSGVPEKLGYSHVSVNLSFVQCMQQDFSEHVMKLVEEFGVSPDKINFEITKPVNKEDYEVLERVMGTLRKKGFGFSMEDFGTGYSNAEAIVELGFDVVKIDRNILWEATRNEMGRIVLDNSVRMIKQLKKKILVEGVEDQRHIDLLNELDVDYLQGYYFSRPVTREQMEQMAMLEDM
ncbi:MAG: EAL domain-containing protein [Lachnospiraceae bacterium]|nr:EAL domain-containing protein [Lachnospiraceae bacterium]